MRKGKTLLLLSMLMFFNLVITPTMASRGIPTDAKPGCNYYRCGGPVVSVPPPPNAPSK
ncbi:hypothetical protein QJS10_CPA10g00602 [Acorus calamus]|uniref:Transmembrane protein n=1 Tax=Acorus calamus TaxID=4465 RepID=A0AAV9DWK1_ACOCL|nr:hypothetical protein QJS10_CPA10g00602 [Acorus calamus]